MKRRNPQDSTLRNVRAAKARTVKIQLDLKQLKQAIGSTTLRELLRFNQRLGALEKKVDNHTQALRTIYESANWTQMRPQKGRKR